MPWADTIDKWSERKSVHAAQVAGMRCHRHEGELLRAWSGGLGEELVEGLGSFFHDRAELVSVDEFGGA